MVRVAPVEDDFCRPVITIPYAVNLGCHNAQVMVLFVLIRIPHGKPSNRPATRTPER